MRILTAVVGVDEDAEVTWPTDWLPPREGDPVALPNVPGPLAVRTVEWLPHGDAEHPYPFVWVVIGRPRAHVTVRADDLRDALARVYVEGRASGARMGSVPLTPFSYDEDLRTEESAVGEGAKHGGYAVDAAQAPGTVTVRADDLRIAVQVLTGAHRVVFAERMGHAVNRLRAALDPEEK